MHWRIAELCGHGATGLHTPPRRPVPQIKMLEWKKTYECTNAKCKYQFQVIADVERDNIIEMPVRAWL